MNQFWIVFTKIHVFWQPICEVHTNVKMFETVASC